MAARPSTQGTTKKSHRRNRVFTGPRPLYTRIKRISLYERHADLVDFFRELEALPNDVANEALLAAVRLGADQALDEARQKLERRRAGLPDADTLQPALIEVAGQAS